MAETAEPAFADYPIIILSFNRPDYLQAVLTSLADQLGVDLARRRIFLLQDGGHNRFSGRVGCSDAVALANLDLFRRIFPAGLPLLSAHNLGVALNFDRAERLAFDELQAEAAVFLEDDLLLGPYYLKTLDRLIGMALADPRIGYVAAYGDHRAKLEEQRAHPARLQVMGHNWAFGLTRRQWLAQRPYVDQYLRIVAEQDYRMRDHDQIVDLFHSWGLGVPGTSQDIAKSHACILTGTAKVRSYAAFGRYIGEQGTNFNAEQFERMGFGAAEMLEEDAFELVPPSDAQLREFVAVARRSAMLETVPRKAPMLESEVTPGPGPGIVTLDQPEPPSRLPAYMSLAPDAPAMPQAAAQPPPTGAAEAQVRVRELHNANQIAAADALAREWFALAPDHRDQFGHPVFLKEITRLALAQGRLSEAQAWAGQLGALISADDPCVQVLFGRAHDRSGNHAAAAIEWQIVLRKDPGNREAQRALQSAPGAVAR